MFCTEIASDIHINFCTHYLYLQFCSCESKSVYHCNFLELLTYELTLQKRVYVCIKYQILKIENHLILPKLPIQTPLPGPTKVRTF